MSDMTTIREDDLIDSVADALQFISYYHPMDYIRALGDAYDAEQGPAAKDAIAQILTNSRMCAEGHRPICQDTGIVNVFVKWGQDCRLESSRSLQDVVDEGVRRAYNHPENKLRASVLADPAFTRRNTRDNTPCVLSVEMVPGRAVSIDVAAKGGGSENKSKFKMMNPSDSIVDWVLEMLPQMGAGWCPPGMLGIGIGGTAEHCVKLAKESLMEPIDMAQLKARGPQSDIEALRIEIFDKVNACLASSTQCSAVPPMPIPSIPGGHQPAPICGSISSTHSTTLSLGFIIMNLDLFSLPPPLAATSMLTVEPGTRSTCSTHGVLSRVLRRVNAGSARTEARSLLSGLR